MDLSAATVPWAGARRSPIRSIREHGTAGPLSGFAQGWQHIDSDWCLLLACDLPNLEASALAAWWHWLLSPDGPVIGSVHSSAPKASLAPGAKDGSHCVAIIIAVVSAASSSI
ncbi:MAG: NTP transferase domain-containing protein [Phormidesmis sp. RL_2_1]|nr:NTP transferase domain-containing protein [Phormidesmis sp. RL_2_1]